MSTRNLSDIPWSSGLSKGDSCNFPGAQVCDMHARLKKLESDAGMEWGSQRGSLGRGASLGNDYRQQIYIPDSLSALPDNGHHQDLPKAHVEVCHFWEPQAVSGSHQPKGFRGTTQHTIPLMSRCTADVVHGPSPSSVLCIILDSGHDEKWPDVSRIGSLLRRHVPSWMPYMRQPSWQTR